MLHLVFERAQLFAESTKLDIFFAYGSTWRNTHSDELDRFVKRGDARIRVVLPDYADDQTMTELTRRFGYGKEDLIRRVTEAQEYFSRLNEVARTYGSAVDVWALPAAPQFTFYRFDNKAILALYSHRKERTAVPTLVLAKGNLYEFIKREFDAMIKDNGLAKKF